MKWKQLVTYSFPKNVGRVDRVARLLTGLAAVALGWTVLGPLWAALAASIFGVAWALTGVVSRCGIYHLIGYTTRSKER